ncbi:hypothetical protein [Mesorhizobium sp. WSM3882]|uniref:hypothetical protein n=1 Tax=Mesorhizobium sp. WSM3882 TaxID=2029407 RepID=UPI0015CE1037|nr:hypothetical protein [Mesorhizobium sp. WSM3882]
MVPIITFRSGLIALLPISEIIASAQRHNEKPWRCSLLEKYRVDLVQPQFK